MTCVMRGYCERLGIFSTTKGTKDTKNLLGVLERRRGPCMKEIRTVGGTGCNPVLPEATGN